MIKGIHRQTWRCFSVFDTQKMGENAYSLKLMCQENPTETRIDASWKNGWVIFTHVLEQKEFVFLWPRQAQFMTILTFIWPLRPWPSTYVKKCFRWHFSSSRTTVQNYFEIHEQMYKLWPRQARYMTILTFIWPLWPWPSTYMKKSFKWHFSLRTITDKLFLKSMNKCTSCGPDKLNIWPFWPLFDPCDLDLQPT